MVTPKILVVYSGLFGANADLANRIEATLTPMDTQVRVRGVKQIVLADHQKESAAKHPIATAKDLLWADGFIFTSPAHTGSLSAAMKAFVDDNHDDAVAGKYLNKTFTAMSTSGFTHGGQERVVNELNAIAGVWGCLVVTPSTANATLNGSDGDPWGLSFQIDEASVPNNAHVTQVLEIHLRRFVQVTECLLPQIRRDASNLLPRNMIADVLGGKGSEVL